MIPAEFPDWSRKMDKWGYQLHDSAKAIASMAAVGMGVHQNTFTDRMQGGAHLLAPTGSDLHKYDKGTILAGFHYDISFMTIHGKSRYPGLSLWTRDWEKVSLKFPPGCLFIQAGASFEHITGGYVLGGFHEVTITEKTKEVMEAKKAAEAEKGIHRT